MKGIPDDGAHKVADDIRGLIEALVAHEHEPDELRAARRLIVDAVRLLEGPRRELPDKFNRGDQDSWWAYIDRSMFGGGLSPLSPRIVYDEPAAAPGPTRITGRIWPGWPFQGGPGMVHGGYVAGLFDHFLGIAQGHSTDYAAATVSLTVRFLKPTPTGRELTLSACCEHVDDRFIQGFATCHAGDVLTAEAEALFKKVDMTRLGGRAQARPINGGQTDAGQPVVVP